MKKFLSLALPTIMVAILSMSVSSDKAENTGINFFSGTWEEALAQATSENKIVFMDAYATWCGPCKLLKSKVFTDPEVGAYFNEHFVNVKMDMERGEGPALARKYQVTAYPTLFFLDGKGNVVKKAIGYRDPAQLLSLAKAVNNAPDM